jgi:hypothetical protein
MKIPVEQPMVGVKVRIIQTNFESRDVGTIVSGDVGVVCDESNYLISIYIDRVKRYCTVYKTDVEPVVLPYRRIKSA